MAFIFTFTNQTTDRTPLFESGIFGASLLANQTCPKAKMEAIVCQSSCFVMIVRDAWKPHCLCQPTTFLAPQLQDLIQNKFGLLLFGVPMSRILITIQIIP